MKSIKRNPENVIKINITTDMDTTKQESRYFTEQQVYEILRAWIAITEKDTSAVYWYDSNIVMGFLNEI